MLNEVKCRNSVHMNTFANDFYATETRIYDDIKNTFPKVLLRHKFEYMLINK